MRRLPRRDLIAAAAAAAVLSVTAVAQPTKAKKTFEITPIQLDQDRVEKKLSSAIHDVKVGGGGGSWSSTCPPTGRSASSM